MRQRSFRKDPDAVLDWRWDLSPWLEVGEVITQAQVFVAEGTVVIDDTLRSDTDVTAWLSGGEEGETAKVTCRFTTSLGRIDDRTITIRIEQR